MMLEVTGVPEVIVDGLCQIMKVFEGKGVRRNDTGGRKLVNAVKNSETQNLGCVECVKCSKGS